MKQKLFLIGALLLSHSLSAQGPATTNRSKYRPGLKLGLSFSTVHVKNSGTNDIDESVIDYRSGLIIGGYYRIRLNERMALQPELHYIFKGWRDNVYSSNVILNYIELPLNLLYTVYGKKGSTFYIGGGPAPSVNLNVHSYFGVFVVPKQFDVGINLLTGFEIPIGFALNLHYTHGLVDFNKMRTGPAMKNRGFGFTIGYTF